MKLSIIGAGYVGLVTGACLADAGHDVTLIDKDAAKIAGLRAGKVPIFEPGLDALIASATAAGRLRFATEPKIGDAEIVFLAVGTPARESDGYADMSFIEQAVRDLVPELRDGQVLVTKSTVPVGTGDRIAAQIATLRPGLDISVASNPEFLREGAAIADFSKPDRIVIGAEDARGRNQLGAVYASYAAAGAPLVVTGRRTAELIKYTANAFLAMKVAFINEIADFAETAGADVGEIARGIGLDPRIGTRFLNAGPGFGGSCFPKDTSALTRTAADAGTPLRMVETMLAVNGARPQRMADKVVAAFGGNAGGKTIALLGLTFKPQTDDLRDSPALGIIAGLRAAGATIVATDPQGMPNARALLPDLVTAPDAYAAAQGADAIVLATEWSQFRDLDLQRLKAVMRSPIFIDLRNLYRGAVMQRAGFTYRSVGRPTEDAN